MSQTKRSSAFLQSAADSASNNVLEFALEFELEAQEKFYEIMVSEMRTALEETRKMIAEKNR
jgi:hypothetical protein